MGAAAGFPFLSVWESVVVASLQGSCRTKVLQDLRVTVLGTSPEWQLQLIKPWEKHIVGERDFVASRDRMSALKPVLLSLHLVLLQFLQSQPNQFCAHVAKHIKPRGSYSIVCSGKHSWSENPRSRFRSHRIPPDEPCWAKGRMEPSMSLSVRWNAKRCSYLIAPWRKVRGSSATFYSLGDSECSGNGEKPWYWLWRS